MEADVPAIILINTLAGSGLNVVADDLHVLDGVLADEVG